MKVTKTTKTSAKWMTLRANHAQMGRRVLQLLANPDSSKSDIQAAAEMYREATDILEAEYIKLNSMVKSTYLPVLTHRAYSHRKTRTNV